MPILNNITYQPFSCLKNKHINTIAPTLFRRIKNVVYQRIRIATPDDDFLDLDFSKINSNTIAIIIHGLEGNSHRAYIKGTVRAVNNAKWDAVALNLRSCSGEPNKLYSSYHSGRTEDLDTVINYLKDNYNYSKIMLIGFSLGGNIVLKYVGERGKSISSAIVAAAGVAVPCNLTGSSMELQKKSNIVYMKRFVRTLKKKALYKKSKYPDTNFSLEEFKKIKTLYDFDNFYTAPAHGFENANDYWEKCSCKQFLPSIAIPSIIISALDDPFLPESCYPYLEAANNTKLYLEVTKFGGHVGFTTGFPFKKEFWYETRIIEFFKQNSNL